MGAKENISLELKRNRIWNAMNTGATWPMCNDGHGIEDCENYLQETLEERNKSIFKKELCCERLKNITRELVQGLV